MRNISDKSCTENQNTHFIFNFPLSENRAFFSDYVQKYGRVRQATGNNIVGRICFACWITKATDTESEYVIPIAFPRQQGLRERALMLRYTYIGCLVV